MPNARDYYQVLGVSPTATAKEIKAAYRTLAKKLHPDVGGSADALAAVNEAADVLTDVKRREAYDRERQGGGSSSAKRPAPEPEPRRPRQKVSIALCPFCDTLNRVKDDPDYVYAKCGHCGRPLGKAGADSAPSPPPPPPAAAAPKAEAKDADEDSFGRLFADAAKTLMGDRLKGQAKHLPGAQKIIEGLQELTDHLASRGQAAPTDPTDAAESRIDELDKYMKKMQDRG